MYSRRLFTVASIFKAGGMNVQHYYSVLETESLKLKIIYTKGMYGSDLVAQIKCEQENITSELNLLLIFVACPNMLGMTPAVCDTELTVCPNCATQPQGTKTEVSGVYGTSAL